jgi:putative transposase
VKGCTIGIPIKHPRGGRKAFIDVRLNNLFAVVEGEDKAILIKGSTLKAEFYWWKREITLA